jgi:hypothetical protein
MELHSVVPDGWFVGTPVHHVGRGQWALYAYDAAEQVDIRVRTREWTAVHPTEIGVIHEMKRCLQEIKAGGMPE